MSIKSEENFIKVFLEFVEVWIHQTVYLKNIYPRSIFMKKKKYRTPVLMSVQPWVNEYIVKTLSSIEDYVRSSEPELRRIVLVLSEGDLVKEKVILELDLKSIMKNIAAVDEYLVQLELSFVSLILRMNQVLSDMKPSDTELQWWIELETTEMAALQLSKSLDWGVASSSSTSSSTGSIIPVMGVDRPIKLQLYIETFGA